MTDLANEKPLEVWRGSVVAWECDQMGHMNVRFYVARAMEGLVGAATALGMPGAFTPQATSTLIVREHHIRFIREARVGAPLHMTVGVLDVSETEAVLLQRLVHSLSGETCATFVTRAAHVAARDARVFPWPERTRRLAEELKVALPDDAGPRSIRRGSLGPAMDRARADSLGVPCVGRGAIRPQDCDVFGRMRPEMLIERISMGLPHFIEPFRLAAEEAAPGRRIGGAALEYRLVYLRSPAAGDPVELRSALVAVDGRIGRMAHALVDPRTGGVWGAAEHVGANFDLDARKLVALPPAETERLRAELREGWGL